MCLTDFAMESKIEIIQINISGEDKPGMTSSLTDILARYDAFILDIGQANIHQSLTLGILFMTTSDKSGAILKELLFKASELGVMIRFTPITEEHYQAWVGRQGKNRYIITLLGRQVTARHIAGVTKAVAEQGLNIDAIKRLTGRMPLEEENRATRACIELSVRGTLGDKAVLQKRFMELSNEGVDISFQKDDIFRRSRRLICFDMDSTLIETEVIDELADRAGVGPEVRAVTESAMRGEIDFTESFTRRIALLRGLDVEPEPDRACPQSAPELLYEDRWIAAVFKPAGMLSVPGKSEAPSILDWARERYPAATGPLVVHRLDMDTSGVLLLALTKEAHQDLQAQFKHRTVRKRYIALLEGRITPPKGRIELPLRPDLHDRPRQAVDPLHGKPAITEYEVLEFRNGRTRIAFYPLTGRTHQLRVHAAHPSGLNAPIAGDRLYGTAGRRLLLHAERIEFRHPATGDRIAIEKPADF